MLLLGVDYGTKRTGLAVGDTETRLAFPLRTVGAASRAELVAAVLATAKEEEAERIVVGLPKRLSGQGGAGETESAVIEFIEALRKTSGISVDTEDERMTTAAVERLRKDSGVKKKSFDRDAAAAAAILETYMQRMETGI